MSSRKKFNLILDLDQTLISSVSPDEIKDAIKKDNNVKNRLKFKKE